MRQKIIKIYHTRKPSFSFSPSQEKRPRCLRPSLPVVMAKTKKNRAGLSEKIANKTQKAKVAKLNPFDIRFVKSKQKVLGRKEKNDVGKPGIARAKAIQKVFFFSHSWFS